MFYFVKTYCKYFESESKTFETVWLFGLGIISMSLQFVFPENKMSQFKYLKEINNLTRMDEAVKGPVPRWQKKVLDVSNVSKYVF